MYSVCAAARTAQVHRAVCGAEGEGRHPAKDQQQPPTRSGRAHHGKRPAPAVPEGPLVRKGASAAQQSFPYELLHHRQTRDIGIACVCRSKFVQKRLRALDPIAISTMCKILSSQFRGRPRLHHRHRCRNHGPPLLTLLPNEK